MHPTHMFARIACFALAAALPAVKATAGDDRDGMHYAVDDTQSGEASPVAVQFATAADVSAFRTLSDLVAKAPVPDARRLAKSVIEARLHVDGDAYTVAHFATQAQRENGMPDQAMSLTEAVMQAFPDHSRHSFLAGSSDLIGGLFGGGKQSLDVVGLTDRLWHGRGVKHFFATVGRFLWSRTGPGYVYNAFFAEGNVVETVREDARRVDDAFGVFRRGGFTPAYDSGLRLSQIVAMFDAPELFGQLPYVAQLDDALNGYWERVRGDWPVLARYAFVQQARRARAAGQLSDAQYRQAMAGGAPAVPLSGPIALAQLRDRTPGTGVTVRRFDINGYTASDLVRFVAPDGSEVMYVPGGAPAFVAAGSERELRQWVLDQAKDPARMDALLAHFSTYRAQDGVFWTGVSQGLRNLGSGRWQADTGSIDHANEPVAGDVFEDMQTQLEARLREDAHMQVKTAWEGWRTTIGRWSAVMLPLSFFPPVSLEVQILTTAAGLGTGIEQGIDGKTAEERRAGVEGAVSTVADNLLIGASMAGKGGKGRAESAGTAHEAPTFVPPRRVNGKLGYPLSPIVPPGWRMESVNRLYRLRDGTPGIWFAEDTERHTVRLPADAALRSDGVFVHGSGRYVQLILRGGLRTARVVPDVGGYRLLLADGREGPRVERQPSGTWKLAFDGANFMAGSMLAEIVRRDFTADARTLHRAAGVLEQFGVSETVLAEGWSADGGAAREPLLILALGHGFLDTVSARLRDPRAVVWSPREIALLAQAMSRQARRPLAFYRRDGTFRFGVSPDGLEFPAASVPADALHLRRLGNRYAVSGQRGPALAEYPSVFAALAEHGMDPADATAAEGREMRFRKALAATFDAGPPRAELRRMHRLWLEPVVRTPKEAQLFRRLSRLRHALTDPREGLTDDQQRWLRDARKNTRADTAIDVRTAGEALALLPEILEAESALLPEGLDHLLVKDEAVLADARMRKEDRWVREGRHYVRLRHPDGRWQVVETGPELAGTNREVLAPGDGDAKRRGTERHVVEVQGSWFPEAGLRDGFMPTDPREYAEALTSVANRLPGAVDEDFANVARLVDSVPQPLLRFIRMSLERIDVAPGGDVALVVTHPVSRGTLGFDTGLDIEGRPLPTQVRGAGAAPDRQATPMPQEWTTVAVPEGVAGMRAGPSPDPRVSLGLHDAGSPVSSFIAHGVEDRYLKTLANTRRLRAMLREDRHIAVVAGTNEHAVTLVMPLDGESVRLLTSAGRLSTRLPAGTFVVDGTFGIRATAADYPARLREVAARWEAAGGRMRRTGPGGPEERTLPTAFAERVLGTPWRVKLWNPAHDPISEVRYAEYMRRRHASGAPVRRAGLDWLETRTARRDFMAYFAPPYDAMPEGVAAPGAEAATLDLHELAAAAIEAAFRPAWTRAEAVAPPAPDGLLPERPKEPIRSAGG